MTRESLSTHLWVKPVRPPQVTSCAAFFKATVLFQTNICYIWNLHSTGCKEDIAIHCCTVAKQRSAKINRNLTLQFSEGFFQPNLCFQSWSITWHHPLWQVLGTLIPYSSTPATCACATSIWARTNLEYLRICPIKCSTAVGTPWANQTPPLFHLQRPQPCRNPTSGRKKYQQNHAENQRNLCEEVQKWKNTRPRQGLNSVRDGDDGALKIRSDNLWSKVSQSGESTGRKISPPFHSSFHSHFIVISHVSHHVSTVCFAPSGSLHRFLHLKHL